jgi:acetoin utilization deacetylase AcuC-like enzyme
MKRVPSTTASWSFLDDGDTYVTPFTSELLDRGKRMIEEAVDLLADGLADGQVDSAFVCIRPPGHHSGSKGPSGFCHQNNAWLAAKEFYRRRIRHCTIFDFDAHHGDGTEDCVRRGGLRGIKFCSTHAFGKGIYPGTGDRTGNSDTILNIPLNKGCTGTEYEKVVETEVIPFLSDSEVIIVSAGYDGHEEDPMGLLQFQDSTYEKIGSVLRGLGKPILYLLEGGYEPTVLARCVERTLDL